MGNRARVSGRRSIRASFDINASASLESFEVRREATCIRNDSVYSLPTFMPKALHMRSINQPHPPLQGERPSRKVCKGSRTRQGARVNSPSCTM